MRRLLLLLGLASALGLFAMALTPARRSEPPVPSSMPRTQVPATLPDPPAPAAALRNVFEYGPQPGDRRVSQPFPEPSAREEATPTSQPADPVRLVGLVSRGGLLRAALAIEGEVTVLAPGQQAFGYTLLSIDRDGDVRLKAPNGAEIRAAGDR